MFVIEIYTWCMNTPIGDKLRVFQDIPGRVAKFRGNRPKDVEKSVNGKKRTRMWANAQRDGKRNPLKFAGVPQTTGWISAFSRPKFTILWGHVEDISLLYTFFSDCRYVP